MLFPFVESFFYVIGVVTCAYYALILFRSLILGLRGFVLPRCARLSNPDLVKKYGTWAVVTGATDGIGLAYVRELAARKVNIVLISRTEEKLRRVAAEIANEFSVQTKIITVDFSQGRPVYERIEKELKDIPVGILVNNVGVYVPHFLTFTEMTEDLIWDTVNLNVAPVLLLTKMLLPQMKKNRKGAIVNLSSMAELQPTPLIAVYSATKTFIRNFTKALQFENRKSGVTIQILSPGIVNTKMTQFTHHILPDSIITPTATQYAKQAIGTLGVIDHTAGFQAHSIITTFSELSPTWLRTMSVGAIFGLIRRSHHKVNNLRV